MSPKRSTKRAAAAAAAAAAASPVMSRMVDYRHPENESWYDVRLLLDGNGALRIRYCNSTEATDELYTPDRFHTAEELEEFRGRFRPTSLQLQDSDCQKVHGTRVCASHAFGPTDARFYNAVVEDINAKAHSVVDEKDECRCEFVLRWEQGPLVGKKQFVGIEHICVLQHRGPVIDPVLERFVSLAKKKLGKEGSLLPGDIGSVVDGRLNKHRFPSYKTEEMETLNMKHDFRHTFHVPTEVNLAGERKLRQDIDLGSYKKNYNYAKEGYYFIRIENLETDLSPCCIVDFIREQTSLSCQVSINPTSISELYSRGFIIVETKGKGEKLFEFLLNPAHIIMSSRGRPWVMNDRWCGALEWVMPTSEEKRGPVHEAPINAGSNEASHMYAALAFASGDDDSMTRTLDAQVKKQPYRCAHGVGTLHFFI